MTQIKLFAQSYLNKYVDIANYRLELSSKVQLHKNRGKFNLVEISSEQFNAIYDSSDWMGRKVQAIPAAVGSILLVTITNVVIPILYAVVNWDIYCLVEALNWQVRHLQTAYSHIVTLVNDQAGQYIALHAQVNCLLYEYGLVYSGEYKRLKEKVELGILDYLEIIKDPVYKTFISDKELFLLAAKGASNEKLIEMYKRSPLAIRNDLNIAQDLWDKELDVYRWLPDSMRYNETNAEKAVSMSLENIRFASLQFQQSHGYDPVQFAVADETSLEGLGSGAFCLIPNKEGKINAFTLVVKLDFIDKVGIVVEGIGKYPILIKDNQILIESKRSHRKLVARSFLEIRDFLFQVHYDVHSENPSFIKYSESELWLLPINDPISMSQEQMLDLFGKTYNITQPGLYKLSKKYIPSLSSKYLYIENGQSKLFNYLHGRAGVLGKGGFHTFKRLENDHGDLSIGKKRKLDTRRLIAGTADVPLDFLFKYLEITKNQNLPFNVPVPKVKQSETKCNTLVSISPAEDVDVEDSFDAIMSFFYSKEDKYKEGAELTVKIFAGMGYALHVLHSLGYIHGDIKPKNYLVRELQLFNLMWDFRSSGIYLTDFDGVCHKSSGSLPSFWTKSYLPNISRDQLKILIQGFSSDEVHNLGKKLDVYALIVSFSNLTGSFYEKLPEVFKDEINYYRSIIEMYSNGACVKSADDLKELINAIPDLQTILIGQMNQNLGLNSLLHQLSL